LIPEKQGRGAFFQKMEIYFLLFEPQKPKSNKSLKKKEDLYQLVRIALATSS
jgi:hypothetical protein